MFREEETLQVSVEQRTQVVLQRVIRPLAFHAMISRSCRLTAFLLPNRPTFVFISACGTTTIDTVQRDVESLHPGLDEMRASTSHTARPIMVGMTAMFNRLHCKTSLFSRQN